MREVDNLLNQGFQFQSITLEKYENIYKKEILVFVISIIN